MSPKVTTALRLDADLMAAMRRVRDTEGIPVTTQLEKAAWEWLAKRGHIKADRKRASTRSRS